MFHIENYNMQCLFIMEIIYMFLTLFSCFQQSDQFIDLVYREMQNAHM